MLMCFLWTVVVGLFLTGAHVVATCAPASWLMPNQGQSPPVDLVIHAQQMHRLQQELWPHCYPMFDSDTQTATAMHPDEHNFAMCEELDSLLEGLQSSWHALHQHSHACSVLGLTPGIPPCSPDTPQKMNPFSHTLNTNLPSIPKSGQQQQQPSAQRHCLQPGIMSADGSSCSNGSPTAEGQFSPTTASVESQPVQAQHPEHTLFPGPILTPPSEQQQHRTGHDWPAHHRQSGPVDQATPPDELLSPWQQSTEGTAHSHWLWGGALLNVQRLWESLIFDTQVVQKQLESEARIVGQACRSCLVPHLHKSHREVVGEVVALLVLGAVCASGLFVAATFYRPRQSARRQTQHNIATQRLRHFEKLQQQQQQRQQHGDVRRSYEGAGRPARLPLLQGQQPSPAVTVKHTRHRFKVSEPTIPSSPSASSSHSEAIGTQVRPHSKYDKAGEPKRARSAQRSAVNLGPVDSLHHGLGRSQSDLSTEAAQHGPFDVPLQSMQSTQGAEASLQDSSDIALSTPSSMAGCNTFNPFHQSRPTHQAPLASSDSSKAASAASVDGSVDSLRAKQAGSKRRNKHKAKSAKKSPPAKRRFIPGLDSEFDPAIHELPTPPQDPRTESVRQKDAVQSVGCSSPSSSSSSLLHAQQQLSVDAPIFVPNGYANMGNFTGSTSQFPSGHLPDWQPQSAGHHYEGQSSPTLYHMLTTVETGSMLPDPAFPPQLSQAHNLPFSTNLTRVSPIGPPLYHEDRIAHTPRPAVPKLSPRSSPTSVLPACLPEVANPVFGNNICGSSCTPFSFTTAGEHQPQLGFVGSPRAWGLPPLLEETVGSPFPGMPCRTSERPFQTMSGTASLAANIFGSSTSAATSMPEQPPVSIASSLPGFNSIWRTANSTDLHSSEDTWQSFTTDRKNSIW